MNQHNDAVSEATVDLVNSRNHGRVRTGARAGPTPQSILANPGKLPLPCRPSHMKNHLLHVLLALAFATFLTAVPALHAQAAKKKAEETELGRSMEKISGAWRKLRRQVADPASNASSLELVATIQAAAQKALTLTPARIEDVPAAEREKFAENYRKGMQGFHAQVEKLAEALKAGDNAAAQDLIKKIGDLQKEAHKAFKRPD